MRVVGLVVGAEVGEEVVGWLLVGGPVGERVANGQSYGGLAYTCMWHKSPGRITCPPAKSLWRIPNPRTSVAQRHVAGAWIVKLIQSGKEGIARPASELDSWTRGTSRATRKLHEPETAGWIWAKPSTIAPRPNTNFTNTLVRSNTLRTLEKSKSFANIWWSIVSTLSWIEIHSGN